jgi:acyl transferase domain-containing protein
VSAGARELRPAAVARVVPAPTADADGGAGEGRRVAFLYTGQGAQYPAMTVALYRQSAVYRRHLTEAAEALRPYTRDDIAALLLDADDRVDSTGFTQPALFAVQYALARTLEEYGVRPDAVLGYSIGEFAAAAASGALDLVDAARLVAVRGAFMQSLPAGGGMLTVRAPRHEVQQLVDADCTVGVAAVNGPTETVLSGDLAGLARIAAALKERGIKTVPVRVSHAFHSPLMAPMITRFARVAIRVPGRVPRLPFYSTMRGRRLGGEPLDGPYWTEHVSAAVRFHEGAAALLADGCTHLVEIGPRPYLTQLVRRMAGARSAPACLNAVMDEHSGVAHLEGVAAAVLGADEGSTYEPQAV